MKRKSVRVPVLVLLLCYSAYCVYDFIGMARRSSTRKVMQELITAGQLLQKSPPGIARAEQFLRRLKAVDTRSVPAELKAALEAFESSIEAAKADHNFTQHDAACAEAKQRLAECFEKYKL